MNIHRRFAFLSLAWVLVPADFPSRVLAAPPPMINYQGRVTASGIAFTGTGHFKFALVNADGTQTLWSHDGTSVAGSAPSTLIDLNVVNGLYSVRLGDTSIGGMVVPVPSRLFSDNTDVRLRIWFDDGVRGVQKLAPDARLASVGFAMASEQLTGSITENNIPPGTISGRSLADGSVGATKLQDGSVGAAKIANGAIGPDQVDFSYGLWKRVPSGLLYDQGNIDIGTGGNIGVAPLHVTSGHAFLNAQFEGASPFGTWLGIGNSTPGGTNWVVQATGAAAAENGMGNSLVFSTSPERAMVNPAILTLAASGNVGINTATPVAPLQVLAVQGAGDIINIGGNPDSGGNTVMSLGLTATKGGSPYLQGISSAGLSYGLLKINPFGGNVDMAPHGRVSLAAWGGGVGIGMGTDIPTSMLQVQSKEGWVNTILDSSSDLGTWLTLQNSSARGTNWVIASGGASTAAGAPAGSLVMGVSPERAVLGTVGLTLSPSGNAGFGMNNPSAPLHVGRINSGGAAVRIGGDPAVNGTTLIDLGMTLQKNGIPYIQGVSGSGVNYGRFVVNPYGGKTQIGPIDVRSINSSFFVHQDAGSSVCASFSDFEGFDYMVVGDNSYALTVNGEAHKSNGNPFWNTTSDRRLKTDIHPLGSALDLVKRVRPVTYRYSEEHREKNPGIPGTVQYGVVAQEFAEVFPDFVSIDKAGYLGVNSSPLIFANTAAIQELHAEVVSRDARIQALESRNEELQQELRRLKSSCASLSSVEERLGSLERQLAARPQAVDASWIANR